MYDFPNSPTLNQVFGNYTWDGQKWTQTSMSGYAPLASPAFTGTPTAPTPAAADNSTKIETTAFSAVNSVRTDIAQGLNANQMAQARSNIGALKKNYVINGAMMISQENGATAGGTDGYYPADQWVTQLSLSGGIVTISQAISRTPAGSPNRIRYTVTAAQPTIGSSYLIVGQRFEGSRIADLLLGTAAAKAFIIQFGIKAPAGSYSASILDSALATAASATIVVAAGEANTDVVKTMVVNPLTSGSFATDNTLGLTFRIYPAVTGFFNLLSTNGNVFELFDVSLTEGNVAPPFMVPDYPSELRACKRYFYNGLPAARGVVLTAATVGRLGCPHPVAMRATPTLAMTANISVADGSAASTITSVSTSYATATALEFDGAGAAGLTAFRPAYIYQGSGNLSVSARL